MSDSSRHYEDGRARLKRVYEAYKEGRVKDKVRAANFCNSVLNNIRNTNGQKAVREIAKELRMRKLGE